MKTLFSAILLFFVSFSAVAADCNANTKKINSKLICYYSKITDVVDNCQCTHVILPANSDVKSIDRFKEHAKGVKIFVTVNEFNQGLVNTLKKTKVDGLEINLRKLDSKNDISDFISTVKTKLGSDLSIALSIPAKTEILAKYYDFKALSKNADLFILQTSFLGASKNVTFHPSRLSGMWDMQNTDSVVDLVGGLGAPLSKLVIAAPVQGLQFKLQKSDYTAPGSPALEVKSITRDELCSLMNSGTNWTLERDQDQAGPYIFSGEKWVAFEDATSMDIKAKYSRIRGLAGIALKDVSQDGGSKCGETILASAFTGLSRKARAPRGAVLHSLEREILQPNARPLDTVQVSPYRISRVIDVEGHVHVIRQDTRTEFECSRQGYFVHPRSCNRFYRCVKFDQLSDDFNVFEFDCPAGLAFDERVEVCVWPGSLPHASACAGSSEIAPVPKERFICPGEQGYYADPENCRWFFACLDHGKSPLSAYEFRCPYGLIFDQSRLLCEWPWLVPQCGNGEGLGIGLASEFVYGGLNSGPVLQLEQYDGLGVLGSVALGGLQGPIEQPVAKVYSNVGHVQNVVRLGSADLSYNAAQSLQNAGLLRANLGLERGSLHGASVLVNQGQGAGFINQGESAGYGARLDHFGTENLAGASSFVQNANLNIGEHFSRGFGVEGAGVHLQQYAPTYGIGAADLRYQNLGGLGINSYAGNGGFGSLSYKAAQSLQNAGLLRQNQLHAFNQGFNGNYLNYGSSNGLLLNQEYGTRLGLNQQYAPAYSVNIRANQGSLGGTNIIGGGYSAVGVKVSNNGAGFVDTVTANPISISTVPAVTAVPIPAVKTVNEFGSYRGGVIANVPELQFRVPQPGYAYPKPQLSEPIQQTIRNSYSYQKQGAVQGSVGYNYPKPNVAFEEVPLTAVKQEAVSTYSFSNPSTTLRPSVVAQQPVLSYQQQVAQIQPAISSYSFATPSSTIRPAVAVVTQQPVVAVQQPVRPLQRPEISTYNFAVPSAIRPAVSVQQPIISQPVISSYSYQKQDAALGSVGYDYPKPNIAFEEVPLKPAVSTYSVSTARPTFESKPIISTYTTPSSTVRPISTYNFKDVLNTYQVQTPVITYQQPQINAEVSAYNEISTIRPAVSVSSKITPLVQQSAINYIQQDLTHNYQQQTKSDGYHYSKPTVVFEEKRKLQPQVVQYQQPAVSSYSYQDVVKQAVGYSYPKPQIAFEERPVVSTYNYVTPKPAVVSSYNLVQPQQTVVSSYNYETPSSTVRPAVSTYNYVSPTTVKPAIVVAKQPAVVSSYNYVAQPVVQKQSAVVSTYNYITPTPRPLAVEQPQIVVQKQPAVVSSFNYVAQPTPTPAVYVEQQPQVVSNYNFVSPSTPRPNVFVEQPQIVSNYNYVAPSTPKSAVFLQQQEHVIQKQPAVVSSYSYVTPTPKPTVYVQEQPKVVIQKQPAVVSSYSYVTPTPKPAVFVDQQPQVIIQKQPAVVSSYSYVTPTPKPAVYVEQQPQVIIQKQPAVVSSYNYITPTPKPAVFVEQQPQIIHKQPAVVSNYNYVTPTPKPTILVEQQPQVVVQKEPAVVSTYNFITPTTPKPAVFVKQPQVVIEKQPAIVENYNYAQNNFEGYNYPKPAVAFQEKSAVVTSYDSRHVIPVVSTTIRPQVIVQKQPAVVSSYSYEKPVEFQGYDYPKPSVSLIEERQPVVEVPFVKKTAYTTGARVDYPEYYEDIQKIKVVQTTPRPDYYSTVASVVAAKAPPQEFDQGFYVYDSRLSTTPRPYKTVTTAIPVLKEVTTSRPIVRYSFSSLDDQYQYIPPSPVVPVVQKEVYLPVRPRVKVTTTSRPVIVEEVSVPTREYLPAPTPTREYLPVRKTKLRVTTTTEAPEEIYEEVLLTTQRPVKVVKVRPSSRAKTVVKVNDYHPLLSAKLGAQCTCVSNTLKLRKKPQKSLETIVVEDDSDYDGDDDGYVVNTANDDNNPIIVENYEYEPQKIVEVTQPPLRSTTVNDIVIVPSSPTVATIKKRVRVRPLAYAQPVTEAGEIFVRKPVTVIKTRISEPSDREIANAVRTGLKLVKQAAKEGAREGTQEAISGKSFDRYGPGGWRSRDETLQGTIDCQRAGLFRHPTQCNKFYACRWDCTKNRFTLHVFNCPVHLTFDNTLGACNWPSQGPACLENTLLPSD